MSDLSGKGARVLLIGTATQRGPHLPDVPAAARTISALRDRLMRCCGVRAEQIRVLCDPPDARSLADAVSDEVGKADTTLLIYYVGHGLWGPDDTLYLAASDTDTLAPGLAGHQAYSVSDLRQALTGCRASAVVVVLDCCFSGQAHLDAPVPEPLFELWPAHGVYLLGSAERLALAPPDDEFTAFSSELITLLDEGDPRGDRMITLDNAYDYLFLAMREKGAPLPSRRETGRVGRLALAPNAAYSGNHIAPADRPQAPGPSPYLGLKPFRQENNDVFHGRDRLTADLLATVADLVTDPGMLLVVGSSGSGKSSLLNAGLLAGVRNHGLPDVRGSAGWPSIAVRPGGNPLSALAARLAPGDHSAADRLFAEPGTAVDAVKALLARRGRVRPGLRHPGRPADKLLLIVDQLEELFTLCAHDAARTAFLTALVAVAESGHGIVVAALRADFYTQATEYTGLAAALRRRQFVVSPMTAAELREAIERPASQAGLRMDDGLPELLLHELGAGRRQGPEPGALPLLSHALLETWMRREGDRLTVRGYRNSGGINGAIETTANNAYDKLDDTGQRAAQRMLLRLVRIGDDTADTARPVDRADLVRGLPADAAEAALRQLTTARLVTIDRDEVSISHESLLHAWPKLADWIEADREWLRTRQQLASDAREWARRRDPSLLYRGGRLAAMRDRITTALTEQELDHQSEEFFHTSVRRERLATRIRRGVVVALAVLLVAALAGITVAWRQNVNARRQADISTARSLIASAESIRTTEPRLALQLGVAALRLDPSPAAHASLAETLTTSDYVGALPTATGAVNAVALSPDGRTLAAGGHKRLTIWDVSQPNRPTQVGEPITTFSGTVSALAWRPDGLVLAAGDGGDAGGIKLWDMTDRTRPRIPIRLAVDLMEIRTAVTDIAWANDGRFLAIGDPSQVYLIEQSSNGSMDVTAKIPLGRRPPIDLFALSANGRLLIVDGAYPNIFDAQLWDLTDRHHPRPVGNPLGPEEFGGASATFSPDGQVLATGTLGGGFQLWDVRTPERPRRIYDSGSTLELRGRTTSLVFIGNTGALLCAAEDGGIQKVLLPSDKPLAEQESTDGRYGGYLPTRPLTGHRGPISTMSYSPRRALLASASDDGEALFWDLGSDARPHYTGKWLDTRDASPSGVSGQLSTGGSLLTTYHHNSGKALLWDISQPTSATPRRPVTFWPPDKKVDKSLERVPLTSVLSPNGRWLAVGGRNLGVQLWDVTNSSEPQASPRIVHSHETAFPTAFAWSGDSRILAVGYDDGKILLDEVNDSGGARVVGSIKHPDPVFNVLTSRTDNRLVLIGGDGTAVIWDTADPANPRRVGQFPIGQVGSLRWSTALSADGRTFAIGHESAEVTLWDLADPTRPSRLASIRLDHEPPVHAVAFSADGNVLATGSNNATQLWDLFDRVQPRRIGTEFFTGVDLRSLIFLHDDRILVSQSSQHLSLWDVSMIADVRRDAAKIACDRLGGQALDNQTWNQYAPGAEYRNTC